MPAKVITVGIPAIFPGRNEQERVARGNRFKANRMKRHYTDIAGLYAVRAIRNVQWDPSHRYDFQFHWVERDRRRDPDNITGACKFIFDGFQPALIIKDSWRHVGAIAHRFSVVSKGEPGVIVKLSRATW